MKVAVSIPDPLFRRAERLARRRMMSRSRLYALALEQIVGFEGDSEITQQLNAVYEGHDSRLDSGLAAAQAEAMREQW
ncbi:MAG: ChpI protein [bacterium]|nr:ChpI protein [bacterium]